ncbi:MAG: hypothetical protein ACTS10_10860 [Kiloniellales bacterium]
MTRQLPGTDLVLETCCKCQSEFAMPLSLYRAARARRGPNGIQFYCPHGHGQHYVEGESEQEKLRRQLERARQREAWHEDRVRAANERANHEAHRAAAFKGQVTKLRKRAGAGLCPCCNRHFDNLERHMASKHPEVKGDAPEPDLRVVTGGKEA